MKCLADMSFHSVFPCASELVAKLKHFWQINVVFETQFG